MSGALRRKMIARPYMSTWLRTRSLTLRTMASRYGMPYTRRIACWRRWRG
jgi:hypothetical protein